MATTSCAPQRMGLVDVTHDGYNAYGFKVLRGVALKGDDLVPEFCKLAANSAPKKAAAASNQDFQLQLSV